MELDDMKKSWKDSTGGEQAKLIVTPQMLESMNDKKYRSKIRKITTPERVGSAVCLAAALFIGLRFGQLDTLLLKGAGVMAITILILLPIISYKSTVQLGASFNIYNSYAANLKEFARQSILFTRLQKLNGALSYLLLVAVIILMSCFFREKNITALKYFWLFAFTIGYIFLLFYSRWVEKFYRKTLAEAKELLTELAI